MKLFLIDWVIPWLNGLVCGQIAWEIACSVYDTNHPPLWGTLVIAAPFVVVAIVVYSKIAPFLKGE